jgi:hypothetical protein
LRAARSTRCRAFPKQDASRTPRRGLSFRRSPTFSASTSGALLAPAERRLPRDAKRRAKGPEPRLSQPWNGRAGRRSFCGGAARVPGSGSLSPPPVLGERGLQRSSGSLGTGLLGGGFGGWRRLRCHRLERLLHNARRAGGSPCSEALRGHRVMQVSSRLSLTCGSLRWLSTLADGWLSGPSGSRACVTFDGSRRPGTHRGGVCYSALPLRSLHAAPHPARPVQGRSSTPVCRKESGSKLGEKQHQATATISRGEKPRRRVIAAYSARWCSMLHGPK